MITESQVTDALRSVNYPGYSRNIVSFGLVKAVLIDGANVTVKFELATTDPNIPRQIHAGATAALEAPSPFFIIWAKHSRITWFIAPDSTATQSTRRGASEPWPSWLHGVQNSRKTA